MTTPRREQIGDCLLIQGDCLEVLSTMAPQSVHCVVTSPPYWGLRDYGLGANAIGLEASPDCLGWANGSECGECYVCGMVRVFRLVHRVLRDDGTCWVVLGDSYSGSGKGPTGETSLVGKNTSHSNGVMPSYIPNIKPKNLIGIPWRVALALQADGWILRSNVIWAKPNPMPESVTDRPTGSHEHVFMFAKSQRYYYDAVAIREKADQPTRRAATFRNGGNYTNGNSFYNSREKEKDSHGDGDMGIGRNKRDVWRIPTTPYKGPHYATFPRKLVEPCLLAGTSAKGVCGACGAPWGRETERTRIDRRDLPQEHPDFRPGPAQWAYENVDGRGKDSRDGNHRFVSVETLDWRPTCSCNAGPPIPATVLDPFGGTGTVLIVAKEHNRSAISIELDPGAVEQQRQRLAAEPNHQFQLFL